jgi:hypothetical protein
MPAEAALHVHQITGALRVVESFLLRGAEQTARRNAWAAVLEDRRRARDRHEVQHVMDALVGTAAFGGTADPDRPS